MAFPLILHGGPRSTVSLPLKVYLDTTLSISKKDEDEVIEEKHREVKSKSAWNDKQDKRKREESEDESEEKPKKKAARKEQGSDQGDKNTIKRTAAKRMLGQLMPLEQEMVFCKTAAQALEGKFALPEYMFDKLESELEDVQKRIQKLSKETVKQHDDLTTKAVDTLLKAGQEIVETVRHHIRTTKQFMPKNKK